MRLSARAVINAIRAVLSGSTAAIPGVVVTSSNPNTTTNTSLTVNLATTTVGQLNVIEISGFANGNTINPGMNTPSSQGVAWTKVGERLDTNGTPASFVAIYQKVYAAGDGTTVPVTWTVQGTMVALTRAFSNQAATNPIPYSVFDFKVASDVNYSIAGSTSAIGLLAYGFANRTGTAWTNLLDNAGGQVGLSSSSTMVGRITAAELASATAFTKTATGSNTSVGVSYAYQVVGNTTSGTPATPAQTFITTNMKVAHRGGDNEPGWGEMTIHAYDLAVANGAVALNVDGFRSADGVWIASHDQTTLRVTGSNLDIPTSQSSSILALNTTDGGYPVCRVQDVLTKYGLTKIIFVENKHSSALDSSFFDLLDTYTGNTQCIVKCYYTAATVAADARARGYLVWGYYYEADIPNMASTQSRFDLLGMDFNASQSAFTTTASYGKPVLAHVCQSVANVTTAYSKGANGVMTGKIIGVMP